VCLTLGNQAIIKAFHLSLSLYGNFCNCQLEHKSGKPREDMGAIAVPFLDCSGAGKSTGKNYCDGIEVPPLIWRWDASLPLTW
jgi:hypothetical protein